ncbi:hypothetical protein BDN72DRAFT_954958 [Pluteus cervinus]|uniref:Uncharacterized protein n=1 Tax=Pluteus cervinus TaxID=181527 RepID=A0ACD3BBV3_9AGAR|nr:hypothetical protein BDN72DRAFT_954958 [Pluteus cervinus]
MLLRIVLDALPLFLVRVISPALVLLATLSLITARPQPPSEPSPITSVVVANRVPRRALILSLLSLSALTFFLDGFTFVIYAVLDKTWPQHTGIDVNSLVGLIGFAGLAAYGTWKGVNGVDVWGLKRVKTAIAAALALDITLVVLLGFSIRHDHPHIPEDPLHVPLQVLLHFTFPAFRILLLVPLLVSLSVPLVVYTPVRQENNLVEPIPTQSSFLIPTELGHPSSNGLSLGADASKYGTFRSGHRSSWQASLPTTRAGTPAPSTAPDSKDAKQDVSIEPTWTELWRRIRKLTPYLWPSKSKSLQFLALICVFILIIARVVNFATPFVFGELIRALEGNSDRSLWLVLFAYVGLRGLQGSGGLSAVRETLWASVMQYSDREMSQLSFDHLLNLSFSWHLRRKTGEILRVLDRGQAINRTLELLLFNIVPTFIDIFIALVVFCVMFQWTLALVIFGVMFTYVSASVALTQRRTKLRRQMNDRDLVSRGIHTDCLLNYETVKYFNGEEHEGNRYREAVNQYQIMEYKVIMYLNLLNLVQNLIITVGLLVGSMMVARRVTRGESEPYEFVVFITYLAQLYNPLNQLGYIYRQINQSLVDTEKLLTLLNEPTEVNDQPDAPDLIVTDGEIEFENVTFSYENGRGPALHNISFKVGKGSSVALVGESGAGKSTILRLLYRFYDLKPGEGRILIDGQDISTVTQKSLRQAIGVVPQDSVLFNSSIMYNIGYGKFGASLQEIEEAARSAQMHDRIMSFPTGYETLVGERGVRLSGGEKQRVAIARTLLKNPPILLLDEATSALDTTTEKDIQKALQNLVQGRSSLSIAHRLSTIASADLILVLRDGQIVEQGNHRELVAFDGIFAAMWADQVSTSNEPAPSIRSKREPSGYEVDAVITQEPETISGPSEPVEQIEVLQPIPVSLPPVETVVQNGDIALPVESAPIAFPTSDTQSTYDHVETVVSPPEVPEPAAVAFPSPVAPEPVAFPPSADETPTPPVLVSSSSGPAVTFGESLNTPPRDSTPDPESEPKRKRISSQNFQRLARRISLTTSITRRQGSSSSIIPSIPGLRRDNSPRVSTDDAAENGRGSTDSPAGSVIDKKDKKEKKEKKRKGTL